MRTIASDLARWESGELAYSELVRRHPVHEVDALVGLDAQLVMAVDAIEPPAEDGWSQIRTLLPAHRLSFIERVKARLQRPVAVALVGTVVSTSAAVAAVPPVRRAVVEVVAEVTDFIFPGKRSAEEGLHRPERSRSDADPAVQIVVPGLSSVGTDLLEVRRSLERAAGSGKIDEKKPAEDEETTSDGTSDDGGGVTSGGSSDSSSDSSSDGASTDQSSDSSSDSSDGDTDRSSDSSSDSSSDGDSSDSSSDQSEDCSSESDECWDGTPPDPDDL